MAARINDEWVHKTMKQNLMIDLETLGTKPNSAILSIGAVYFDKDGLGEEFYANVDLQDSIDSGFDIDASTVYWWLSQSSETGKVLSQYKTPLVNAINSIHYFVNKGVKVWANSPSFDLVMLKNHFDKLGFETPWDFWNELDFRTFVATTGAERVKPKIAHDALEDAKAQAQTIINYWNKT